jgi:hypothetical protein
VERLLAGPAEVCQAARASLVQAGAAAVPALNFRLLHARGAGTQVALVQVLTAIGEGLSACGRVDLTLDLAVVRGRATDGTVVEAIDRAVATLRRLNERAASPTAGGRPAARP